MINECDGILKSLSDCSTEGYEIHMGQTISIDNKESVFISTELGDDGFFHDSVYGTYIHGFLDSTDVVRSIVKDLCTRKGLKSYEENDSLFNYFEYKQQQYDKLAKSMEDCFDIDDIIRIIEKGK